MMSKGSSSCVTSFAYHPQCSHPPLLMIVLAAGDARFT
eukprot:COSAG01_NODE_71266_length_256_cov_0.961783_1_plen_37_part_10